jgi:hypothetical protein
MLGDLSAALPDWAAAGLTIVTLAVLSWWTYRRVAGDGEDPSIGVSGGSGGGYVSFLVSGFVAVAFVVGGLVLGLGEQIAQEPALAAIPAAFLVAHLYVEAREA